MKLKFNVIYLATTFVFLSGCSTYNKEDFGEVDVRKRESSCVNMDPAQEAKCKEREQTLVLSLGADKNCNHPYEYERNKCKNAKAKQKKLLNESLKKHKK